MGGWGSVQGSWDSQTLVRYNCTLPNFREGSSVRFYGLAAQPGHKSTGTSIDSIVQRAPMPDVD
eukprot:798354-Rhodomonas_salina.1